jgi:hypothetical protein
VEGGAPLFLAPAQWHRESGGDVELRADGHVLVDGDLVFVVDRVGRVANDDYDPYAVLLPDGNVVYFDTDGERTAGGQWQGCNGPVLRTCTLVTQLLAVSSYRRMRTGVGIGVGVGVGVGVGF